jgi:hypothetical protein
MINDNDQTIFEIFRYEEMPDIKAKPGIYAWYYQPRIEPNWSMDNVVEEISNIAKRLRLEDSKIQFKGKLNLSLIGSVNHITLGDEGHSWGFSDSWKDQMERDEARIFVTELLNIAAPILANPIYIGISKNLKRRINDDHLKIFLNQKKSDSSWTKQASPYHLDDDGKEKRAGGLEVEHLIVGVRYMHASAEFESDESKEAAKSLVNLDDNDWSKFSECAETIVNRLFYPIFGKR